MAYVSEYGNYGAEKVLVFEGTDLTGSQWETLSELSDQDKFDYVDAILRGELTERFEE